MDDSTFKQLKQDEQAQNLKVRGKKRAYRDYKAEYARAKERLEKQEGGIEAHRTHHRERQRDRRRSEEVKKRNREYAKKRRSENPELAKKAKESLKAWREMRQAEAREIARKWRSQGCCVCGESNPCCIDAHHKDQREKSVNIATLVNMGLKPEVVVLELNKCIPICANCHRKYHDNSDKVVVEKVEAVAGQKWMPLVRGKSI